MRQWYLEGFIAADGGLHKQALEEYPFIIGREKKLPLSITMTSVSRRHAVITENFGTLYIEDMGSSNGTFVNHTAITVPTAITHGDVIHVGDVEIRLMHESFHQENNQGDSTIIVSQGALSSNFPAGVNELEEMLSRKLVKPAFQSIVYHDNSATFGYEILGRGGYVKLPESPGELFQIAESAGLEVELSELFREEGVKTAMEYSLKGHLFINTHPSEMNDPDRLMSKIFELNERYPSCQIVLEVHEQAITDMDLIKSIKLALKKRNMLLSYDDFGVGQSRLLELVEAAPDVLKFDRALVHDIHKATPAKLELLQQLHQMAQSLGIKTLGECISQQEDYDVCKTVGFDFYQGFLFAKPRFIDQILI